MRYDVCDITNGVLESFNDRQKALDYLDKMRRDGIAEELKLTDETGYSYAQVMDRVHEFIFMTETAETPQERAQLLICEFEDYIARYSTAPRIKAIGREFCPAHALFLIDRDFYLQEFETYVCDSEDEDEVDAILDEAGKIFEAWKR